MGRIFTIILIALAIYGGVNHLLNKRTQEEKFARSKDPQDQTEEINTSTTPTDKRPINKRDKLVKKPSLKLTSQTSPQGSQQRGKHDAFTDESGNLYPTKLLVDEEHVIAYGDLIVGEARFVENYQSGDKELKVETPKLWPKGVLPYRTKDLTEEQERAIEKIASDLKAQTQIQLITYIPSKHKSWITFKAGGNHCYSQVGFREGESIISLNPRCGYKEIYHEIFHILGFFHEQNRFDRDEHVQIIWENINEEHWTQFERFAKESFPKALQRTPFTFDTFMLYPSTTFSNSSDYSIVTIDGAPYPSHEVPSFVDYSRLKSLYRLEITP